MSITARTTRYTAGAPKSTWPWKIDSKSFGNGRAITKPIAKPTAAAIEIVLPQLTGRVASVSSGKIVVSYSSSGTTYVTFTSAITLNTWMRVEGIVTASATAGQVGASLYTGDSGTAVETHTSAATLNTASSDPTSVSFGDSNAIGSLGPYWVDDVGLSSTGYLGAAVTPTITTSSLPNGASAEQLRAGVVD